MPTHQKAEEIEKDYIRCLGSELGVLFYHLHSETIWLNWKWKEYTTLFGTTPSRIDLLNRAAPAFFRVVQDALWENIVLHMARLTDPAQSPGGKKNLTLKCLPEVVAEEIRPAVNDQLQAVHDCASFARDWRNRHIAHRDRDLALSDGATSLAPASRELAHLAIEAINKLLNIIDVYYRGSETYFAGGLRIGNAEHLLCLLRDGLEAEERRQKQLERGILLPEDVAAGSAV